MDPHTAPYEDPSYAEWKRKQGQRATKPRDLQDEDVAAFDAAANDRDQHKGTTRNPSKPIPENVRQQMYPRSMNSPGERFAFFVWVCGTRSGQKRLRRLENDIEWLKNQLIHYGADPNDVSKLV